MMKHDPDKHHRRSIRLKDYDYAQAGVYFVTLCTYNRECLFGEVMNGKMALTEFGDIVREEWERSAEIRHEIALDEFVIMPNHIHGIVIIRNDDAGTHGTVGAHGRAPLPIPQLSQSNISQPNAPRPLKRKPRSLGAFIAGFKSAATKRINTIRDTQGASVWQRNYYERIVRDDRVWNDIREYIADNPANWFDDSNNLKRAGKEKHR